MPTSNIFELALQVGYTAPPTRSPSPWPPGLPTRGAGGGQGLALIFIPAGGGGGSPPLDPLPPSPPPPVKQFPGGGGCKRRLVQWFICPAPRAKVPRQGMTTRAAPGVEPTDLNPAQKQQLGGSNGAQRLWALRNPGTALQKVTSYSMFSHLN